MLVPSSSTGHLHAPFGSLCLFGRVRAKFDSSPASSFERKDDGEAVPPKPLSSEPNLQLRVLTAPRRIHARPVAALPGGAALDLVELDTSVRQHYEEIGAVVGQIGQTKLLRIEKVLDDLARMLSLLEMLRVCGLTFVHDTGLVLACFGSQCCLRRGRRGTTSLHSALCAAANFSIQPGMAILPWAMACRTDSGFERDSKRD